MKNSKDIVAVLDGFRPNAFLASIWVLCSGALFLDGYNLTVIAVMPPEIVKELGYSRCSLGLVFSAGLVGMALGAPLGGWIDVRHGRRLPLPAVVGAIGGRLITVLCRRRFGSFHVDDRPLKGTAHAHGGSKRGEPA